MQVQTFLPNTQHGRFRAGTDLSVKTDNTADFVQVHTFLQKPNRRIISCRYRSINQNKQDDIFRSHEDLLAKANETADFVHVHYTFLPNKQYGRLRAGTDFSF